MAWHWQGNKPLPEPMMVRLLMHIFITQPQWVNRWPPAAVTFIFGWSNIVTVDALMTSSNRLLTTTMLCHSDDINIGLLSDSLITFKQLGICFQNVISFSNVIPYKCHISVSNWSNTISIYSALWILMTWCFSTRASVATVLHTH